MKNEENKKEILLKTNFLVDATESTPETNSIICLINKHCSLKYDMNTYENNIKSFPRKFTYEELFSISELPEELFKQFLYENNIFELGSEKILCKYDFSFLKNILLDLLKIISDNNSYLFYSCDEIFVGLNKTDNKYSKLYKVLKPIQKENIIKEIAKISINKNLETEIVLNAEKIKLFLAQYIFSIESEKNLKLDYFIKIFNKFYYMYMPQKLITEDSEKNNIFLIKEKGKDNLYPYYSDYDLRFLKGKATIYFNVSLNAPVSN